ncbi:uncharacterized protein BT62DRAFT_638529 [Guyanagaster necrorhizus]|uniref:Uncharacterized protein n=1 Tax=Guyanagaster necrorhizus TaxID=856835 RepID=A0A9P7VFR7_9AGAR|nr:uncharacterized protein BT62DRAFT_638529 [Guyanagaster necrorhizus MCA 3950]KAG7440113.1 hypothetical protein BT62DRAFT_638529 [Guyanagaster necrorhizus MCA 3950]
MGHVRRPGRWIHVLLTQCTMASSDDGSDIRQRIGWMDKRKERGRDQRWWRAVTGAANNGLPTRLETQASRNNSYQSEPDVCVSIVEGKVVAISRFRNTHWKLYRLAILTRRIKSGVHAQRVYYASMPGCYPKTMQ